MRLTEVLPPQVPAERNKRRHLLVYVRYVLYLRVVHGDGRDIDLCTVVLTVPVANHGRRDQRMNVFPLHLFIQLPCVQLEHECIRLHANGIKVSLTTSWKNNVSHLAHSLVGSRTDFSSRTGQRLNASMIRTATTRSLFSSSVKVAKLVAMMRV